MSQHLRPILSFDRMNNELEAIERQRVDMRLAMTFPIIDFELLGVYRQAHT